MNASVGTMHRTASQPAVETIANTPSHRARDVGDAIVIATINREVGDTGVHAHTRALSDGLRRAGKTVEIISAFGGSRAWLGVFAIRRILLDKINKSWSTRWHRHWHRVALRQNLLKRCSAKAPAAIIAQCPLSAAAALSVRDQLGLHFPVIGVCHFNHSEATEYREKGELSDERAFQSILSMEADVLQRVDAFVYVSAFAKANVEQDRSILPKRSVVIWNGIDADQFVPAAARESIGLSADDVVLANVGSLESRKNQLGLLEMFALLASASPSVKLVFIGDGPDRKAIESKIASLNLVDRVRLLGYRSDVPALLAACDLYVHYAKLENCPVVLLEAARAGLPVATLPAGGAREVLDALGAGVLLDPADVHASADKIRLLVENESVRKQIGEATARGFNSRFTQHSMVRAYLDVLQSCGASI